MNKCSATQAELEHDTSSTWPTEKDHQRMVNRLADQIERSQGGMEQAVSHYIDDGGSENLATVMALVAHDPDEACVYFKKLARKIAEDYAETCIDSCSPNIAETKRDHLITWCMEAVK